MTKLSMDTATRIGARIALVGVALAAVVAFAPRARSAGNAAGAAKTHFGTAAADVVTLELQGPANDRQFVRVRTDGTYETATFTPPAGTALHIREAEFVSGALAPSTGPFERTPRLRLVNIAQPTQAATVAILSFLPSEPPDDGAEVRAYGSWRSDDGPLMGQGCRLALDAPQDLVPGTGDPVPASLHGDCVVRGYLVRAR